MQVIDGGPVSLFGMTRADYSYKNSLPFPSQHGYGHSQNEMTPAPPPGLLVGSDTPAGIRYNHQRLTPLFRTKMHGQTPALSADLVMPRSSRALPSYSPYSAISEADTVVSKADTITGHGTDVTDRDYAQALDDFEKSFPIFAKSKSLFEGLRKSEFSRMESGDCTYLDYTGAALAPQSLIEKHCNFLRENLLGNPHSENHPSALATTEDTAAREAVLRFCNADPSIYTVVWTANASAALKLVGESFPFDKSGAFVYAPDSHNSVLGISQFARSKGAAVKGFKFGKNWSSSYDYNDLEEVLSSLGGKSNGMCMPFRSTKSRKLLVFPGQSNVSGIKHCTERILDAAHQRGWDVMIDTAALAPTSGVDLSKIQPEFLCLSFYKIFGYPTGIGCLVAKKSALARCKKPWFAGGTVRAVAARPDHLFHIGNDPATPAWWEDGTINFQQTSAVRMGLEWLESVGIHNIRNHTSSLAAWMVSSLRTMKWSNGRRFCFIPEAAEYDEQGSTVSMLVLSPSGMAVPHRLVEKKATSANFAVRTGIFCNPGTGTLVAGWHNATSLRAYHAFGAEYKAMGLLRVSVGVPTTFEDCYRFISFLRTEILAMPDKFEDEVQQAVSKVGMQQTAESAKMAEAYYSNRKNSDTAPPIGCMEYKLDT